MTSPLLARRLLPLLLALVLPALAASPPAVHDVRAYGAVGDGRTLDSDAINRAITAAAASGGGTVLLPAGDYLSYTLRLRSHVTLQLGPGATLIAADPPPPGQPGGYDAPEPNPHNHYQDFGHSHFRNSLIVGEDLEGVAILGPGRIYGRGLSRGNGARPAAPLGAPPPPAVDGLLPDVLVADGDFPFDPAPVGFPAGPFGHPQARDVLPAGVANKAIALKSCRNVTLRDFTLLHGGHFGILATEVDNLTIDNLLIDTNRDGIDIDACSNVRISNCSVNSPWDDAICLKSSHALGRARLTENVTITNCLVSGYDEGTLLDGTRRRTWQTRGRPHGRIKLGTESGGGFRNIAITNCVFEHCRGLALEQVDGGILEDVVISNVAMHHVVNAPIFIRLGARLRSPDARGPGHVRRILIENITAWNASRDHGIILAGLRERPIEDVVLANLQFHYEGGGTTEQAARIVPEYEKDYPDPYNFGTMPAWGLFARHVKNLRLRDVDLRLLTPDARPAVHLENVTGLRVDGTTALPDGVHAPVSTPRVY